MNQRSRLRATSGDGLASTERSGRLRMVEEDNRTAHALDADVKSDGECEEKAFRNQGDEICREEWRRSGPDGLMSAESWISSRCARAPLRSGKKIIGQGNGPTSCSGHFSFHLAVA